MLICFVICCLACFTVVRLLANDAHNAHIIIAVVVVVQKYGMLSVRFSSGVSMHRFLFDLIESRLW